MGLRDDERGQSIWIGVVLLLGVLMLVYATYQVAVVPSQNAQTEFQHAQAMEESMRQFHDRVYLAAGAGGTQSITMDLGPNYQPRLVALNPPVPAGSLTTRTSGDITMSVDGTQTNLSAICGYGSDGVPTRSLAYRIDYNEYSAEPTLVYSHTVLYKRTDGNRLLLDERQTLVQNTTVTLLPLTSSFSQSGSGPVTLEMTAGPINRTTVTANDTIRLTIPTQLPASKWSQVLADQPAVSDVVQQSDSRVTIALKPNQTYTLVCSAVGLEQAPPSGVRPLGQQVIAGDSTATATPTPTPTPTPADHRPNATIESATATRERKGSGLQNNVTVEWSARDIDGDLASATVQITDLNTSESHSKTYQLNGGSASDTYTAIFGRGQKDEGNAYEIVLYVTDDAGNSRRKNTTIYVN